MNRLETSSLVVFRGAMIVGLLSFLFGCGENEAPFQQKDGAWYYHATLIANADRKTFEMLSPHYARDVNRVYWGDTYRESQDYFSVLDNHYSKNVFYSNLEPAPKEPVRRTIRVKGADAGSFGVLDRAADGPDAKDRDHTYRQGQRVN